MLAALLAGAACSPGTPLPDEQSESVLNVGVPDDVTTLDTVFASGDRSLEVIMNCYEPLMTHAWTDARFVPEELAGAALEAVAVADGRRHLDSPRASRRALSRGRGGDGVDGPKRLFERNFSVPGSGGRFVLSAIGRVAGLQSIEVTGEYELTVRTEERNPLFPRILVLSNATPFDPALLAKPGDDSPWAETFLASNTAGAGPYRLERWTPGVEIELVRNESYWRGPAPLERVVMKIVPAAADRMMLLSSGALDVVERLSAEEIEALSNVAGLRILSVPSTSTVQLGMNNRMPPFDDPRVRRAIAYALPYEELLEHVYFGRAVRAIGPVSSGLSRARSERRRRYAHGSREIEASSSSRRDSRTDLDVELAMDSGSPDDETLAVFVRAAARRGGRSGTHPEAHSRGLRRGCAPESVCRSFSTSRSGGSTTLPTRFSWATPAKASSIMRATRAPSSIESWRAPAPPKARSAKGSSAEAERLIIEDVPRPGSSSPTSTWRCASSAWIRSLQRPHGPVLLSSEGLSAVTADVDKKTKRGRRAERAGMSAGHIGLALSKDVQARIKRGCGSRPFRRGERASKTPLARRDAMSRATRTSVQGDFSSTRSMVSCRMIAWKISISAGE